MPHYVIIDSDKVQIRPNSDRIILSPSDFVSLSDKIVPASSPVRRQKVRVINLCNSYDYLSKGYYCSLMAEARDNRCIPSVEVLVELNWKRLYERALPGLNDRLARSFKEDAGSFPVRRFHIYFGRTDATDLQEISRRIFDTFRSPILEVEIRHRNKWEIVSIEPLAVTALDNDQFEKFHNALDLFTGAAWPNAKANRRPKKWIAILHDPNEQMPPSNPQALKKFIQAAESLGAEAELITRQDLHDLIEYDALFIRETTSIDDHTFRFARKAEEEGIPVIDDSKSILRCCNKVYLFELLHANNIPTPGTTVLDRKSLKAFAEKTEFPIVLKLPDGSFSRGVHKAKDQKELTDLAQKMFNESDFILAQEYMPSEFDWRVGILNGQPIYVCKYYMAKNHWQIVNHTKSGNELEGDTECLPLEKVPTEVVSVALKAAALIGNGLYGVDLKQTDKGVFVIEVNDNPSIDTGYKGAEDELMGMELYKLIMRDLLRRAGEEDVQETNRKLPVVQAVK